MCLRTKWWALSISACLYHYIWCSQLPNKPSPAGKGDRAWRGGWGDRSLYSIKIMCGYLDQSNSEYALDFRPMPILWGWGKGSFYIDRSGRGFPLPRNRKDRICRSTGSCLRAQPFGIPRKHYSEKTCKRCSRCRRQTGFSLFYSLKDLAQKMERVRIKTADKYNYEPVGDGALDVPSQIKLLLCIESRT